MIKKTPKILFIIIFSFILLWSLANITGYFIINEFVKTDYFENLVVEKLQLKNDINYHIRANIGIHWNPLSFGLAIKDFSFKNIRQTNDELVDCNIQRSDIKFSILQLFFGNIKPQEIFIKNGNCIINDRIFQKNTSQENKVKRIDEMFNGIKTLSVRDSTFEFNKKKYFADLIVIHKNRKKITFDVASHNEYIQELKCNGEGIVHYDEWNRINLDFDNLDLKLNEKSFKLFPKIQNIEIKSQGNIEVLIDDFLKLEKINFNLDGINGDFLMKNGQKKQQILNGEIAGNYTDSLKVEKIKFNLDKAEVSGKGEFMISERLFKGVINFKNALLNKITNFWPSNVAPNTQKFYNSSIKNGEASGNVDLKLQFSNSMEFLEKKSRINLNSEIKNASMLCCEKKFPEIKDINGKIKLTLDGLSGEIKQAKIDNNIDISETKINLNFNQQKLLIDGKAQAKVKSFIDLYEKDYKIEIFDDDILKNITGDVYADAKLSVDLKNNNKVETDIEVHSKNISSLLEKNNLKIDQGTIFMKIKNDNIKIDFKSNSNGRIVNLIGDINSERGFYQMKFDEEYSALKKTFDPIIGHLITIDKRVSGEMEFKKIKEDLFMKFDFNLDNAELKAKYLKLDKKIGEKAKVNFILNKHQNHLHLQHLTFESDGEPKHKIKIDDLQYLNNDIKVNKISINERNLINKIEFKETPKERIVRVVGENVFYNDFNWMGFTSEDTNVKSKKISISGESEKLSFHDNSFFSKVVFEVSCDNGDCQKIVLNNCESTEKTKINASLIDGRIIVATNNGGKLLQGLDITNSVNGGGFYLEGYLNKYKNGATMMENSLVMKDFHIKNAPIVARILSLASLGGLLSIFSNKGVHFSQLNANFVFADDKAIFAKSVVEGQAMAIEFSGDIDLAKNTLDLDGSLMPFNFINMVLRILPGIGKILVGSKGEGLLMMDFTLDGSLKNPAIHVNPMTFFTPYTIRKIMKKGS